MKKLIFTAIIATFFSCNNKTENNSHDDMNHEGHEMNDTAETAGKETEAATSDIITEGEIAKYKSINAETSQKLMDGYLTIKEALVKTNGMGARTAAENIYNEIENQEGEGIGIIREDLEQIAGTGSVEHQREHFKDLSNHIYAMVKSSEGPGQTLYRQYCPMAFDNTGAFWLSSSEEILNPYFGDKMLKCGSVKETIN